MDNICHTLVGAALARTGLGRRTSLGAATMMIGANFPDIDIATAFIGRSIELRRGWTHGVLAMAVLPLVLTGLVMLWDRRRSRRGSLPEERVIPKQLLILAALSIWTHPALDWMNSYGLRWLMPFDGTWFYGDSLFIIDPWLLAVLGGAVWLSRRREKSASSNPWRPARIGVAVAALYIASMLGFQNVAASVARRGLAGTGHDREKLVVTASPANPLRWRVHADDGARYWNGHVSLVSRRLLMDGETLDKGIDHVAVAAAIRDPRARPFMDWARLPFYRVSATSSGTVVRITDARYGASVEVPVAASIR